VRSRGAMAELMVDKRKELEKLSVKDLRRQAAIHNVMLTQISAAVEKIELVNLILRAGPVRDTYDVSLGLKVHTAASIAAAMLQPPKPKEKKKKKKKSRRSSSSSSSESGRKRKRSKSRKRSRSRRRKKSKSKSRSPSLVVVPKRKARAKPALRALPPSSHTGAASASGGALKALPPIVDTIEDSDSDEVQEQPARAPAAAPSVVQEGVAAAAALGFDVLPREAAPVVAPAPGLRPSVNPGAAGGLLANVGPGGAGSMISGIPGMRVCMTYMSHASCMLGANCPDTHIMDPEEEMRVRARFKEQECNAGAGCNRKGCLYRHPGETVEDYRF